MKIVADKKIRDIFLCEMRFAKFTEFRHNLRMSLRYLPLRKGEATVPLLLRILHKAGFAAASYELMRTKFATNYQSDESL